MNLKIKNKKNIINNKINLKEKLLKIKLKNNLKSKIVIKNRMERLNIKYLIFLLLMIKRKII